MDEFDLNDGFDNQAIMLMRVPWSYDQDDWLFSSHVVSCREQ